jgi:hypothetical protein
MINQPIFSTAFLAPYLAEFRLSAVTNLRHKMRLILDFQEEITSGKVQSLKEEEIKSRFLNTVFGEVLGFSFGTSEHWMLREEKKATIDGTKPDGVLGYFTKERSEDDVRAIIEVKNAQTSLDGKQKRSDKRSAVEQAFEYAPKMPGRCKWVIVSNLVEIRIYPSLERAKYQRYEIIELAKEEKLKEFLFLFHKDRLIKRTQPSNTDFLYERTKLHAAPIDTSTHIIDQIFDCLKRFEGLGFVDPYYLASISPFNILKEHVWHYNKGNLFTLNPHIFRLLKELTIYNDTVLLSNQLAAEITEQLVVEAPFKLQWIFKFLHRCTIQRITAIRAYEFILLKNKNTIGFSHRHPFHFKEGKEGITWQNEWQPVEACDCISCNYRSLDFLKIISKLKKVTGNEDLATLEHAYGHYLLATEDFKAAYRMYDVIQRRVKGQERKSVVYFLSKLNTRSLFNLVHSDADELSQIKNDIISVDLNKVIFDEIEFEVDRVVLDYLISIKEDQLVIRLEAKIDEVVDKIEALKRLYEEGGTQQAGPHLPLDLYDTYLLLYYHINGNFIVYDVFDRYKRITERMFKGLLLSYQTPDVGLQYFTEFVLLSVIIHVHSERLKILLASLESLKVAENDCKQLFSKLLNLLNSYFEVGLFGRGFERNVMKEQLLNYQFQSTYTSIFSNFFLLGSKLELRKDVLDHCKQPLLSFLEIESVLSWSDLESLGSFLESRGGLFNPNELEALLKVGLTRNRYGYYKYGHLLKSLPAAIFRFYPSYRFGNIKLINKAILDATAESGELEFFSDLLSIVIICDEDGQARIFEAFNDRLNKNFAPDLYERLLLMPQFHWDQNGYFQKYVQYICTHKNARDYLRESTGLSSAVFVNFIIAIYECNIDFKREELLLVTAVNNFEDWLLHPFSFEYSTFDPSWLLAVNYPSIMKKISGNDRIKEALDVHLRKQYSERLSKIRHTHF